MSQDAAKPTEASRHLLLCRLSASVVIHLLVSLGLCVGVGLLRGMKTWILQWEGLGLGCLALLVALGIGGRFMHYPYLLYLRGYLGYFLYLCYSLSLIYLLGCHLPVSLSQPSFCLGLSLLLLLAVLEWLYLVLEAPKTFKAYVVIPVGLMVTLALYGGVLLALPIVHVGDLILWTFLSAAFTLYFSLKLQSFQADEYYSSQDFFLCTVRLYTDFLPSFYSLLKS